MLLGQTISIPDTVAFLGGSLSIPIIVTDLDYALEGLEFTVQYNDTVLAAISTSFDNTELEGMDFNVADWYDVSGEITLVVFAGGSLYTGSGTLIFINFDVIGELLESTTLAFTSIEINNISILDNAQNGSVVIKYPGCMDINACNYDKNATVDDGSCADMLDCAGVCGGDSVLSGCNNSCNSTLVNDCAGVCGGNSVLSGCDNTCDSMLENDDCGVCGGDNTSCTGCKMISASNYCDGCTLTCFESFLNDCCEYNLSTESILFPREFGIQNNYPNPFNPITTINYSIATFSEVNISIYSMAGEFIHRLVNSSQQPGEYAIQWNASNSPSGLYFVKLISEDKVAEQKVLLIK